jgi:hypothetical protein
MSMKNISLKGQTDYSGTIYPVYVTGQLYNTRANSKRPYLKAFAVNLGEMTFGDMVTLGDDPVMCLGPLPETTYWLFLGVDQQGNACEFALARSLSYGLTEIEA